MHPLLFLLLLDYSGSMDQVLHGRAKIQQLKTEVNALMSTAPSNQPALALVFGAEPRRHCRDIQEINGSIAKVAANLKKIAPGVQGKTPLAHALELAVAKAQAGHAKRIVAVTDGGDTCGQNPCVALKRADRKLSGTSTRLVLDLIGFDLKGEKGKLECLKHLKLQNIKVNVSEAGSAAGLQSLLKSAQMEGLSETADPGDGRKNAHGIRRAKVKPANGGQGAGESAAMTRARQRARAALEKTAFVEILGAPSTAKFQAQGGRQRRDWLGSYVVKLQPGTYVIRYLDANGGSLKLDFPGGTHTKIPWASLFKIAAAPFEVKEAKLSLKWYPSALTKQIHGDVHDFETTADLNSNEVHVPGVPLGEWEIEVTSPPWLKGNLPRKRIAVTQTGGSVDLQELFDRQLIWIENPDPSRPAVLEIQEMKGGTERYFISPGQARIPVQRQAKATWLHP